jgi:hypothetical protein
LAFAGRCGWRHAAFTITLKPNRNPFGPLCCLRLCGENIFVPSLNDFLESLKKSEKTKDSSIVALIETA